MNGGNDMLDVRAAIFSLEKILKIGIISSSEHSNVRLFNYKSKNIFKTERKSLPPRKANDLPSTVVNVLDEFKAKP